jgi:hypothetical protein
MSFGTMECHWFNFILDVSLTKQRRANGAKSGKQQHSWPITWNVMTSDADGVHLLSNSQMIMLFFCHADVFCPECLLELIAEKGAGNYILAAKRRM